MNLTFFVNFVIIKYRSCVETPFQHCKNIFILGNCPRRKSKMDIVIENLKDYRNPITLDSIFKEDTQKLYNECKWVMQDCLYPHVIHSSSQNTFYFGMKSVSESTTSQDYTDCSQKMLDKIPKENLSISNWKMLRNLHFSKIFQIAKKHNVTMRWCGNDSIACGDQWIISMAGKEIGILRI